VRAKKIDKFTHLLPSADTYIGDRVSDATEKGFFVLKLPTLFYLQGRLCFKIKLLFKNSKVLGPILSEIVLTFERPRVKKLNIFEGGSLISLTLIKSKKS